MFELLFQKFDEKIKLTEEEKQLSSKFFISKKLRKKQYLLQQGDVCNYAAFVEKGLLRSYTINDKGKEGITQFAFEGWWIANQLSLLTGNPSEYNIDSLEDSELLLLTKQAEEQMLEKIPKLERYFRILLQNSLIATQKRLASSLGKLQKKDILNLSMPARQHFRKEYLSICSLLFLV
ncbi:MAG TPA: cyclic nucleotide-binding domain-containing protein [Chitinophagaceae bacterium]|nr:cyclic nucleotide-binding domain-containing protein [Chitinophagaceae bacterium]